MNSLPLTIPFGIAIIYFISFATLICDGNLSYLPSALSQKHILYSISYSFFITIVATAISIILGTLFAKWVCDSKYEFSKSIMRGIIYIPHFLMAFYVYEILGQSDILVSSFGFPIIMAYVLKQTAFVTFYILPIMAKIKPQYYDAATLMGASKFLIFRTVVAPRLVLAYIEIALILISFIMTAYEIPYILGTTYPKFFGIILYNSYFKYSESGKQEAIAIMFLFVLVMMLLGLVLFFVSKNHRKKIYRSEGLY